MREVPLYAHTAGDRAGRSGRVSNVLVCSGAEAGSYLRLIDSCITQLKDQGPSRTCNESKEEEDSSGGLRSSLFSI